MNDASFELQARYFAIHEEPDSNEITAACTLDLKMPPLSSESLPTTPSDSRCLVLCLDKSGSMSGAYFESLKRSSIEVGEKVFQENFCDEVYTIFYSGSATFTECKSMVEMRKTIQKETAGGSTNFSAVYEQILRVLLSRKKKGIITKELYVLFFTDGLADNRQAAISGIEEMKEKIKINEVEESQFFSIGFSNSHDANLLNLITKAGTQTGGFFFIPSDSHDKNALITQYMNDCWTLMGGKSTKQMAVVSIPSLKIKQKIYLREEGVGESGDETAGAVNVDFDEEIPDLGGKALVKVKVDEDDDDEEEVGEEAKEQAKVEKKEVVKNMNEFIGELFLDLPQTVQLDNEPLIVNVHIEGAGQAETVLKNVVPSQLEMMKKTIDFINLKVFQKLSFLQDKKSNAEDIQKVATDLEGFDVRMNQIITDAFKLHGPMRKECMTDCQVIKGRIREAISILRECLVNKSSFSNIQIAKLNDLAYRGVHHKGLQKKLDQRAMKNQPYFEKLEKELESLSKKVNQQELRKQHGTLVEKIGCCPLSVMDCIECLTEGDAMCMCLDIHRPEASIADPTKLVIKDVTPTYMTATAFLDSAGFFLEKNEQAHGGFNAKTEGKLAEGIGRENVTGVMPLYLFKEHWAIARRNCPKVFGLMCTADVMGFTQSQLYTIPFLVLCKLVDLLSDEKTATQARQFQFDLVLETCIAIVRPRKELSEEYVEDITKFCADPANRTADQIASVRVMLGRFLTLNRFGAFSLPEKDRSKFFHFAMEEEMRRMIKKDQEMPPRRQIMTMLDVDWAALVDSEVNKEFSLGEKKGLSEEDKIALRMKEQVNQKKQEEEVKQALVEKLPTEEESKGEPGEKPSEKTSGAGSANVVVDRVKQKPWLTQLLKEKSDLNELANSGIKQLKKKFGWFRGIMKMVGMGEEAEIKDNAENRHILAAILLQNLLHPKNSQRRDAIEKKEYHEIRTAEDADKFFGWLLTTSLLDEIRQRKNDMMASLQSNALEAESMKFAATQDIYFAAGVLQGKTWGGNLRPFFTKLQTQACPLAFKKIQMLVMGKFEEVTLIADKGKKNPQLKPIYWNPALINKKKFWRQNVYESKTMTQEEFIHLFPDSAINARKLWLINVDKIYHRDAQKIVEKEFKLDQTKGKPGKKGKGKK